MSIRIANVYLKTNRIILREVSADDEQDFFDLDSDAEVMKYISDGKPSRLEDINKTLLRAKELYKKYHNKFGFWTAIEEESEKFIGWFHFRPCKKTPDDLLTIELGYRLKKEFWGKGYATEVSLALIEKGFNELNVTEVFAKAMKENSASQKVMEKAGLNFTKDCREEIFPGISKDAVKYSITKPK